MTKLLTAALTAICLAGPAFAVTVDNPEDIAKAEGIQTPFQTEEACDFKGTTCLVAFNILPPSQRLVIEFLSGACGVIGNNVISLVRLTTTVSGVAANHAFVIGPPLNSGFSSGFVTVSQQVRIYADPGSQISVSINASGNNTGQACDFAISGQLVAVP